MIRVVSVTMYVFAHSSEILKVESTMCMPQTLISSSHMIRVWVGGKLPKNHVSS